MSYLDDPEHEFVIDPAVEFCNEDDLVKDFKHIVDAGIGGKSIELILQGFLRLQEELPDSTTAQCFGTSMVWYFG
jgi:hypothetical protein